MKNNKNKNTATLRLEQNIIVRSVRNGLTSMIPVLIIGAFSLIIKTFPVSGYQNAIATFAGGIFLQLFDLIYGATFGVLAVYMTYSISRAYMKIKADPEIVSGGAALASLLSFFILSGAYLPGFGTDSMGPKSLFLAILTGLGASALYFRICKLLQKRRSYLFTTGSGRDFNRMLSTFIPIVTVALIFGMFNVFIIRVFNVDSFRELIIRAFNGLFSFGKTGFLKGFFFVLLSSVLWFFGIHGSDALEGVMQAYFTPGLEANQAAVAAGGLPENVLTKQFFDCFVLMGGCGATICLLIAIFIFSKNHSRRRLGITAAFPMIFNINELMVFGLPIILNPVMLIPFLTVPLVCYSVSYLAIVTGIVPMITSSVDWTTPILLGGYTATGSIAGSLLQLFNLVIGVLIYMPFVKLLDRKSEEIARSGFESFVSFFRKNEQELVGMRISDRGDIFGDYAKGLIAEFRHDLDKIELHYQPQYAYNGKCVGAEALLRWNHPMHGMIYPPLLIKLAGEGGFLGELEETILSRAIDERPKLVRRYGEGIKLSVNVTWETVLTQRYYQFCRQMGSKYSFANNKICIEVTEQTTVPLNRETFAELRKFKELGLMLAIDDFSMGQTSLHYLKDNIFDIIKLDGSLVQGLSEQNNSREIVSSIVQLARSINLTVVAEFVGTEEQRELLHEIGCDCYQGYLYSPALPADGGQ